MNGKTNGLNNDVTNLEWATHRENMIHKMKTMNTKSKYPGVTYDKTKVKKKWVAMIYHNGKNRHIGYYLTEEEAHQAIIKYEQDHGIKNKYR